MPFAVIKGLTHFSINCTSIQLSTCRGFYPGVFTGTIPGVSSNSYADKGTVGFGRAALLAF